MNEAESRAASEKYYQDLRKKLDERIRSDKQLQKIAEKVANKTANFNDTAKYSEIASNHLANVLQENIGEINSPLAKEYVCKELLKDQHSAINELFGSVQVSIDEQNGIHIKTQKPAFPQERVDKVAHALEDPTVSPKTTKRRAGAPVANVSKSFHDDCVKKNATFRNDAGLTCYIIREGSNCCEWCSSVAGKYRFGTQPDDIFRRHDNCDCTIIYDGQVLRGQLNLDGVTRNTTWQQIGDVPTEYEPTSFTQEQAKELERQNLQRFRGLTSGKNSGTIKPKLIEAESPYKNPKTPLSIDSLMQSKHIKGGKRYNDYMQSHTYEPSVLTISEEKAQELVNRYHGTGILKLNKNGELINSEIIIDNDEVIGYVSNNLTGATQPTSAFKIQYGTNGTHIVPTYESQKEYWRERRKNNGYDWLLRQKS